MNSANAHNLVDPFAQIFSNRAEAGWAFDFLRETVKGLGIRRGAYDPRFALTLTRRSGQPCLHLNFGGWLVAGFCGPGAAHRVELTLLADRVAWEERLAGYPFDRKEGQPEVRTYHLPLELIKPMTGDLRAAYEASLAFIAAKFEHWQRPSHWQQHQPELVEALFDLEKRAQLFAGLLLEPGLRYERHFTAFPNAVAEEGEEYQLKTGETDTAIDNFSLDQVKQMDTQSGNLAEPFSRIFVDRAEAQWAFDFLRNACKRLGIVSSADPRFALTLPGNNVLRLNFGNWATLSFYGPSHSPYRVHLNFIADKVDLGDLPYQKRGAFSRRDNEPEVVGHGLPVEIVKSLEGELRTAYEVTLDFIAEKFKNQRRCPWRSNYHLPEIGEALFNPQQQEKIFNEGLSKETLKIVSSVEDPGIIEIPEIGDIKQPYPLPQLAADTGFDEAELARWLRAIERKGQAILYGPPGTGKTFLAEKLAGHLIGGGNGFVELVQFHPAYAYEDFIQGIRPEIVEGHLSYQMDPGRFLEFCRRAEGRDTCVLIIDEINRANLARVFGELMYLLEFRNREIPLAGGGGLKIPANVRLIGTMNTADRSIALVDHALRRRFAFLALYPNYDLLRRYHQREQTGFPVDNLIKLLQRLNRKIDDPHYEVGVTFFLRRDLAEQLADIWEMEIVPYLEEYFFDRRDEVALFRWSTVAQEIPLP